MRKAIISDIHANLEALETALEWIKKEGIEQIICLGDIVGYGANPNECVDLIREYCTVVVKGNHDSATTDGEDLYNFNPYAKKAVLWTKEQLSKRNYEYLYYLPLKVEIGDYTFVHSTPKKPERWNYIITEYDATLSFSNFEGQACLVGHSHLPGCYGTDESFILAQEFTLTKGVKYIINVGSVGQPRDGDPRLCFGVLDEEKREFAWIRLEYDKEKSGQRIIESGLPAYLSDRLKVGR